VRLTDFEALSFDCYGTLIDWETGLANVLEPWAADRGLAIGREELLGAYSSCEAAVASEHPGEPYPGVLARSFGLLGEQLRVAVTDGEATRLARSVPDWPPFADSHDALVALSRRFKLIILSNVDRQSFAGSNRRLDVAFTSILTAQDIGSYKPDPRNFAALEAEADRLEIREGRLLHVAQSLFHDHVPAKQIGLSTVWINRRHDRPGWGATPEPAVPVVPDWEFPSLEALAQAVQAESQ
jgi:2-haloalkanoic acid dehalogenase type II